MKTILFILLVFTTVSCYDTEASYNEVKDLFPDSEIYQTKAGFRFVVIDSSSIKIVNCMSPLKNGISSIQVLKKKQ